MCINDCPSGYFKDVLNQECTECNTDCLTCFGLSSDNCLSCKLPLYF